jgi:thiamine pyrophosphokinase
VNKEDFFIYCDSGLKHKEKLGVSPNLIIGDFDSHSNPYLDIETIVLPVMKDDTDTAYAAKEAIRRGFRDIILCGVTGGRQDHTLVNIFLLFKFDSYGIKARIIDDYAEMEVLSPGRTVLIEDCYLYFSLVNMTGIARGITIKNAKYNLSNAKIESENQYATGNEVLPGKTAEVSIEEGRVLLLKVRRE